MTTSSVFDSVLPMFYLSKIIGLAPFSLPPKKSSSTTKALDFSIALLITSILLYFTYLCVSRIWFATFSDSIILNICGQSTVLYSLLLSIISIFLTTIFRHKITKVLKLINDCDKLLLQIGANIQFQTHWKCVLLYLIISITISVSLQISCAIAVHAKITYDYIMLAAKYRITNSIFSIVLCQFQLLLWAMKTRFAALNETFR